MTDSVWQTVLAILVSFGGAGAIILAVGKWLANLTAEKILKKTEFEFSQKLEALKSNLEKKNYVSKVRFDLEIDVYRSFSKVILDLAARCKYLPTCSIDSDVEREPDENEKQSIDNANKAMNTARGEIMRNAVFIPKKYMIYLLTFTMNVRHSVAMQHALHWAIQYQTL